MENKTNNNLIVSGRRAVLQILNNPAEIEKILVKTGETEGSLSEIVTKCNNLGVILQYVPRSRLDQIQPNNQGVIALCSIYKYANFHDIVDEIRNNRSLLILILDRIMDPNNFGAIIRTAHSFGVDAIIIPKRRSCDVTASVVKASTGACNYIKIAKVSNLSQTIDVLKKLNIWIAACTMEGENIVKSKLTTPLALIIGNEGEGVSTLLKTKSDFLVSIPMAGNVGSLNASVAAALAIYEIRRNHA